MLHICSLEFLVRHSFAPVVSKVTAFVLCVFGQHISVHPRTVRQTLLLMYSECIRYERTYIQTSIFTATSQFCQTPSNKGLLTIMICRADTFFFFFLAMMKESVEAALRRIAVWRQHLWSRSEENLSFH